jgi:chemotaxis protein methyltransferase CheR
MLDEAQSWFDVLRRDVKRSTGVVIETDRASFVASRLASVARDLGFPDSQHLCMALIGPRRAEVHAPIIDAMVVNETSFFRDKTPFETFRNTVLPAMLAARANVRALRIWCAACSTGQEAYSIAMTLDEEARALSGWRVEITGVDVSQTAIEAARAGAYNQFQVQRGLAVSQLLRYFRRSRDMWTISEHIRERVRFERMNLLDTTPRAGAFDVIFCRNLMLYLDAHGRRTLLERLSGALTPDGYLFLGATETALGSEDFQPCPNQPWLARPRGAGAQAQRPHLRVVGA